MKSTVRTGAAALAAALLVLVAAACGDEDGARTSGGPTGREAGRTGAPVEIIVTSDDARLPEGCRPGEVAGVVAGFVEAFNAGDEERLARLFFIAEGPSPSGLSEEGFYPWSWYSVSEVERDGRVRDGFVTYDERALLRHLARRQGGGERMRLLKVNLTQNGILGNNENMGFVSALTLEGRDLEPGLGGPDHLAVVRGALNCEGGWIFAWSMEMRTAETRDARAAAAWLCDDPPGWRPGEAVVACA